MKVVIFLLTVTVALVVTGGAGTLLYLSNEGAAEPVEVMIADVSSERLTRLGPVVGFAGPNESHAWLGIPYARAASGDLRWQPPQRPEPWTGTYDALAYGSPCVQIAQPIGGLTSATPGSVAGSEDCLYLNVWTPRYDQDSVPKAGERLPVMFWIHGGGNTAGAADGFYDGSLLAARHQVVVVTLNYRLGPFGWFSHPSLTGERGEAGAASGNFGTLDLIAGLRWVEENIEYFGGDAERLTVFGESAGGTNVVSLLLSPAARGLFHRAIVQSGSTRSSSVASAQNYIDAAPPGHAFSAREVVLRLLIHDGSASDRASGREFADGLSAEETAEYLRSKSAVEIMEAYRDGPEEVDIDLPRVIRDGQLLPTEPALDVMAAAGRYNAVPVILGANRDEAKLRFSQDERHVDTYLRVIMRLKDEANYQLVSGAHSEMWRVNAVHEPADALSGAQGPSVFAYRFDWDEEPVFLGADLGVILGAGHGLEIPFVFGHFRFGGPRVERLIFNEANLAGRMYVSESMMSYWAEFAYSGAPGRGRDGRLTAWQPWAGEGAAGGALLVIDTPAGGGIRMSRERLSRDSVIAGIDRAELLVQAQKCEIFLDLFGDAEDWNEEAYFTMGRVGCREHPPASVRLD